MDDFEALNDLENLAIIVKYVNTHLEAGHDLENPDLVTDLGTLLIDLHRVLDALGPPATLEQRVAFLVREVVKIKDDTSRIIDVLGDEESSF